MELRDRVEGVFAKPDTDAQYYLGLRYANGTGVPKDGNEAVTWFRRAADSGHAEAQRHFAFAHLHGRGVPTNEVEGMRRLRIAAGSGDAPARIRYTGFDQYGDPIDCTVDGFHVRVVQHECDHLIGKLCPMRVRDFSRFGFAEVLFPGLDAPQDD